jgi:metallo-beta-lactamase family protein
MAKSKKENIKISFIGENAHDVTGSMILVEFKNESGKSYKILLECGLYQSNSMLKDMQINSRAFKFKPRELTHIFFSHNNIDHIGLVPALYSTKNDCKADIYIPKNTKGIMKLLLEDSCYITTKNAELLSKQGKTIKPIYESIDVDRCLNSTEEFESNVIHKIDNNLSFRFTPSGHLFGANQTELFITLNNVKKTLLYTGDIGNLIVGKKHFVEEFKPVEYADILIGESTYAMKINNVNSKTRLKDLEKIKTVVYDVIDKKKGRILIPSFSFARTQEILSDLYTLFKNDEKFSLPIYLDSPLAIKITEEYLNKLDGAEKSYLNEILHWDKLEIINSSDASKMNVTNNASSIIISASGMCMAGRVMHYLPRILEDENSFIVTIGYSSEDSILGKIKSKKHKTIFVEKEEVKNKCNLVELKSYSSHIQHKEMLEYYSSIKGLKQVYLVHGDFDNKVQFAELLEQRLREKCMSTKVYAISKDDVVYL